MNMITRDELIMALTQYYQDSLDNPEDFSEEYGVPVIDAINLTNEIFEIIKSNHE